MKCLVYRSTRKADTYLFLDRQAEDAELPQDLRALVGPLEFALELELAPERRLARTDGATVLADIDRQGFHLQLPPGPDGSPGHAAGS